MHTLIIIVVTVAVTIAALGLWQGDMFTNERTTIEDQSQGETVGTSEADDSVLDAIDDAREVKEIIESRGAGVLNLSGEGLTTVPKYVFEKTNTTVLDLSGNSLSGALPAEVRHLQQLEKLDLSDNNFTGVPAEIGQLSKLRVLDLSNNPITGLPLELGNLKNLTTLDLRGTQYSSYDLGIIKTNLPNTVTILVD